MNILFVHCNFRLFNKLDTGAANRNTMFVKALSQLGHVDIISFYGEPINVNIENCDVLYNKQITNQSVNDVWKKLSKLIKLIITPWLPEGYYHFNIKRYEIVEKQLRQQKYDYIACRYIGTAVSCGLLKYSNRLIVDIDDNPANALKNNLHEGNFKHFWSKWIMMWQSFFIGYMTKKCLKKVRLSFFSNILEPPYKESVFLHNVSTENTVLPALEDKTPKRILTVGYLDYPPNRFGVNYFINHIFPKIKNIVDDVEFYIVGKTEDEEWFNYLNSIDGVKALGFVDDLTLAYKECRVVIIPVYQGSGTCVKFVEGLMMNRPIVSTPVGARGFDRICKDGTDYILANHDNEFADGVVKLLNSIELSKTMASNAHNVYQEHFSQNRFMEIVTKAINTL